MSAADSDRPRRRRLSRSGDFRRAYREGNSRANRFLVVYRFDRSDADGTASRLGISVSRKVGNSVARNRVKRVLGEGFWAVMEDEPPAADFVLVARPGIEQMIETEGLEGVKRAIAELVTSDQPVEGEGEGSSEGERST
jgi:ribonuclease P protein component